MKPTELSRYSELLLFIYRQAQELPVHEFQDEILAATKPHIPFDSSMWGTARMTDDGIDIHSLHLHNTTQAMIQEYQTVKHLDIAAQRVTSQPTATVTWDTEEDPTPPLLKAFLRKYRHQHIFITSDINPISRFVQWISLYRADKTKRCRAEEAELLASLAPHMMQALAINRLVHLDRLTGEDARERWSVAIADQRGILYHADLRFRELVKVRRWMGTEDRIPEDMLTQLLGGEAQICFGNTVVRRSMERGLLFLKARERTAVDDLTSRELLVASLLVSGLTHKEVALKLDRSPETIRSQMKSIFEKLGVNKLAMLGPMLATRE